MSVTRFRALPLSPLLLRPCPKVAFVFPSKKKWERQWGCGGRQAKEKRILLAQFFLFPSLLSRFFIYFYCVTRLKCALQIFMPAKCLKREQNMFICDTHTHRHTHTPTHTCKFPAHLFAFFLLTLFCVFYFVRESKFVVVELSTRQKSWLCATPPFQTTPLCAVCECVCVCALNIPTLSEFICPDNAILVSASLRRLLPPPCHAPFCLLFLQFCFLYWNWNCNCNWASGRARWH